MQIPHQSWAPMCAVKQVHVTHAPRRRVLLLMLLPVLHHLRRDPPLWRERRVSSLTICLFPAEKAKTREGLVRSSAIIGESSPELPLFRSCGDAQDDAAPAQLTTCSAAQTRSNNAHYRACASGRPGSPAGRPGRVHLRVENEGERDVWGERAAAGPRSVAKGPGGRVNGGRWPGEGQSL